jgi:hypothetical protein
MTVATSASTRNRGQSFTRSGSKVGWLALWLSISAFFLGRALSTHNAPYHDLINVAAASAHPAARPIEEIRVGQRVVAGNPDRSDLAQCNDTKVDPKTWRLLRLHAEDRWADGTLDTIEVEALEPQADIVADGIQVGSSIPLPASLIEMGFGRDIRAKVIDIAPCPPIASGPGRVVLATTNHLNPYVYDLQLADSKGHTETVRATGPHKFYSADRRQWISVDKLQVGEHVPGVEALLSVASIVRVPGVHRVYNMTVEDEHVYHVAKLGALVHNVDCTETPVRPSFDAAREQAFKNAGMTKPSDVKFSAVDPKTGGKQRCQEPKTTVPDTFDLARALRPGGRSGAGHGICDNRRRGRPTIGRNCRLVLAGQPANDPRRGRLQCFNAYDKRRRSSCLRSVWASGFANRFGQSAGIYLPRHVAGSGYRARL